MRKLIFLFPGYLLIGLILIVGATSAAARPPEITKSLEPKLYHGSNEEISTFIGKRQELIENLITEIVKKKELPAFRDSQHSITSVIDLYQGILSQYKGLLVELPRDPGTGLKKPQIEEPFSSLNDFDQILKYEKFINLVLTEKEHQFTLIKSRLNHLREETIEHLSEYSRLYKTAPKDQLLLYESYGKLLSMQCEYALLYIRKPKLEAHLKALYKRRNSAEQWIREAFIQLTIKPEDIKKAQKIYERKLKSLKNTTTATSAEYHDLNRRLLIYETRFDNATEKVKTNNSKSSEGQQENWQIERERIELIRSALTLRIHLIEQKRLSEEIGLQKSEYRLQWLKSYVDKDQAGLLRNFIKTWAKNSSELDLNLEALIRTTSEATLARSNLVHKQVTINNLKAATPSEKRLLALNNLGRQAKKTTENIDKLIVQLSRNSLEINNLKFEVDRILRLSKALSSKSERVRLWSVLRLAESKKSIENALYYPLFSIGTSIVTLAIILKIIFLFIAGIFLLRLLRRQVSLFMEKKAGMSTGSINSITTLGYYIGVIICSIIVLSAAGLDLSQLGIVLGALGVGIGFGLQTITNNFISGLILLTERTVKVGDYVNLKDGVIGKVKKMSIRTTIIRDFEGIDTIVPNSDLIANRVETWTYGDDWRRLNVPFGVAYDSDPEEVVQLAMAAAREVDITREDFLHPLRVFFEGFGDNSLDFSIRPWCRISFLQTGAGITSDYYFALFKKLKEADIAIPFPQHDLHLASLAPEVIETLRKLRYDEKPETDKPAPDNS